MELYLLKVRHIADENYDPVGIFSSEKKMDEARREYLRQRRKAGIPYAHYTFTSTRFTLDKIY